MVAPHLKGNPPTVSVIVPVYNGARTIGSCLESLLGQTYPGNAYEIIVVENGSNDNTTAIVAEYPVTLYHSQVRGPAAARNLGVSRSRADIVAFTDADCVAHREWLVELIGPYEDADTGGVGGTIHPYSDGRQTLIQRFCAEHPAPSTPLVAAHGFMPYLYTANCSYRRPLITQIGGFNANLLTAEDVDLAWRLQIESHCSLRHAANAIVYHRSRSSLLRLSRQYRQYGFGEIVLDTMYARLPGYPRNRRRQGERLLKQLAVMPRYALSGACRWLGMALRRTDRYAAARPLLLLLVEASNVFGKLEALAATRIMRDAAGALALDPEVLVRRFYG
jgi:glycosyltransferase involved in cell wall biosynthesis